jgi:hypothetical protein
MFVRSPRDPHGSAPAATPSAWRRRVASGLLPVGAVVAALAGGPGCVQRPVVAVHHAEVRGLSSYGVNVAIILEVKNENAYDVQIRHVNCNVIIGRGYVLGPIDFAPNQWLPANQTTLLTVPATIPWTLAPALLMETSGSYAIPYQVKGSADVTATRAFGIERDNYPIDQGGFVPRQMVVESARPYLPFAF